LEIHFIIILPSSLGLPSVRRIMLQWVLKIEWERGLDCSGVEYV
jgi:hypothetical protein